ncbi:related to glyoxal oxidase precursor [Phialocephala subalpina]|uniref:Related to glyoxal oxidase n=1 Tax=Phialocephala subalpina TaxID=576137 RepID=A0A1L7WUV3_9HELO|nr:related to glyoxal oxidase precursor [Phialocephala subalpina]
MRFSRIVVSLGAVLSGSTLVDAFWRMPCRSRSGLARIDPLVSNGTISEHAHAIHGSDGFSTSASYESLLAGSCTSCEVAQDKSAYWTPAMYFLNSETNEYKLVEQVGGMLAYYLLYPNSGNTSLSAFPAGFEMIAGDTNQRNFTYPVPDIQKSLWNVAPYNTQAFLRQAALGFNCLNYAITPEGSLYRHFLPDKAYLDAHCTDGLRLELMFPSCWNGVDRTSTDKKSHVAYPSQVMTGDCPSDFPERLPSLFYETIWDTYAFNGINGTFMMGNGDPSGFGYHGDFMMGWEEDFLQQAVDTCTNLSGQIEDCALFTIQDSSVYGNCNVTLPSAIAKENVVGAVSTMPGNPVIAYGPGYASGAAAGGNSATATAGGVAGTTQSAMTLSYSAGISLASSESYVPGGIFAVSTGASFALSTAATSTPTSSPSVAATSPTTAAAAFVAASIVESAGPSYFSTAYQTLDPNTVEEILWLEEVITVTEASTATVTVPARKRHLHGHRRGGNF